MDDPSFDNHVFLLFTCPYVFLKRHAIDVFDKLSIFVGRVYTCNKSFFNILYN